MTHRGPEFATRDHGNARDPAKEGCDRAAERENRWYDPIGDLRSGKRNAF